MGSRYSPFGERQRGLTPVPVETTQLSAPTMNELTPRWSGTPGAFDVLLFIWDRRYAMERPLRIEDAAKLASRPNHAPPMPGHLRLPVHRPLE